MASCCAPTFLQLRLMIHDFFYQSSISSWCDSSDPISCFVPAHCVFCNMLHFYRVNVFGYPIFIVNMLPIDSIVIGVAIYSFNSSLYVGWRMRSRQVWTDRAGRFDLDGLQTSRLGPTAVYKPFARPVLTPDPPSFQPLTPQQTLVVVASYHRLLSPHCAIAIRSHGF